MSPTGEKRRFVLGLIKLSDPFVGLKKLSRQLEWIFGLSSCGDWNKLLLERWAVQFKITLFENLD